MNGDLTSLALATAVRALPAHRRDWGRAMRAELAAVDERPARLRFVLSCVRAVLASAPVLRSLAAHAFLLGFAAVTIRRAAQLPSGVRAEANALVAVIAVLAWCGRHVGPLGPVGTSRAARLVRLAGYGAVLTTVTVLLSIGTNDPGGWWLAALTVSLYLVGFLRATAHPMTDALSLPIAATLALSGLALWWIPMLLLHASVFVAFVAAVAVIGAGAALGTRAGLSTKGLPSGLAAATGMLLLIFLAAVLTYRLFPGLAPDIAGPGGRTPTARAENNRAESLDPYIAEFILGALLSGVLTVISVRSGRQAVSSRTEPVRDLRTRSRTGMRWRSSST